MNMPTTSFVAIAVIAPIAMGVYYLTKSDVPTESAALQPAAVVTQAAAQSPADSAAILEARQAKIKVIEADIQAGKLGTVHSEVLKAHPQRGDHSALGMTLNVSELDKLKVGDIVEIPIPKDSWRDGSPLFAKIEKANSNPIALNGKSIPVKTVVGSVLNSDDLRKIVAITAVPDQDASVDVQDYNKIYSASLDKNGKGAMREYSEAMRGVSFEGDTVQAQAPQLQLVAQKR